MSDALSSFKGSEGGGGLFMRFKPDEPVKLRVLTTDPLVSKDKWGNTRYSFVVWNHTEDQPQILSKGMSILKQLQEIHTSDDWGQDIRKVDLKITATGEGMETRYTVMPLPNSKALSNDQIKQASQIKLEDVIKFGIRMSDVNEGSPVPEPEFEDEGESDSISESKTAQTGYVKAKSVADQLRNVNDTFDETDEVNLDDIPF